MFRTSKEKEDQKGGGELDISILVDRGGGCEQCCGSGSGSGRIRNFLQDPDPDPE
jgi:hypothetical protein